MMRALLVVVLVLLASGGAMIGYYNAQPVHFDYLAGALTWPLSALLLAAFALGALLAVAIALLRILALRLALRRSARQLKAVETELRNLRNLPLPAAPAPTRSERGPG
jgi:uncharacterized membrane protein YciS (DUF1049 family)